MTEVEEVGVKDERGMRCVCTVIASKASLLVGSTWSRVTLYNYINIFKVMSIWSRGPMCNVQCANVTSY